MCSATSNCSRIDAVKATANQLKLQKLQQASRQNADTVQAKAVKADLQDLDASIKVGDAQKAELALSNVRQAISKLDSGTTSQQAPQPQDDSSPENFRQFLAYA